VPDDAQKLYDAVKNYDYLVIMPPAADVDFSKGHIRDIAKLYTLAEVLRREGKLSALPQYQNMILRPERVTEAGMAEASNSARSASVESSDAFARKLPGKPRPFK